MNDSTSTKYDFRTKDCFIGAQMLFVAFGALVLVPLLNLSWIITEIIFIIAASIFRKFPITLLQYKDPRDICQYMFSLFCRFDTLFLSMCIYYGHLCILSL